MFLILLRNMWCGITMIVMDPFMFAKKTITSVTYVDIFLGLQNEFLITMKKL